MLGQLERTAGGRLEWFAVTHEHRDHRHVHAVVISQQHLNAGQFRTMPETGDANARMQQRDVQRQRGFSNESVHTRERDVGRATRKVLARQVGQ